MAKSELERKHENRLAVRRLGRLLDPMRSDLRAQSGMAVVTAIVDGSMIVEEERFEIMASHNEHSPATVSIFWEKHGYKAHRALGLPGQVSADYQGFSWNGRTLIVKGRWPDGRDYSVAIDALGEPT